MSNIRPYDKPLSVEVVDGEVVIRAENGPAGVSLTPRAAAETAEQLAKAASLAAEHQDSQGTASRD